MLSRHKGYATQAITSYHIHTTHQTTTTYTIHIVTMRNSRSIATEQTPSRPSEHPTPLATTIDPSTMATGTSPPDRQYDQGQSIRRASLPVVDRRSCRDAGTNRNPPALRSRTRHNTKQPSCNNFTSWHPPDLTRPLAPVTTTHQICSSNNTATTAIMGDCACTLPSHHENVCQNSSIPSQ